ncbi:MAG: serine hydrolase domain-containing protein [Bacteroidota bacterium]
MKYHLFPILFLSLLACDEATFVDPNTYTCTLTDPIDASSHPDDGLFRDLLLETLPLTTGAQMALTDSDGQSWVGSVGYADIANDIELAGCHRLMIASISKVVTATMIMQLQDEGILDIDDPLMMWIDNELINPIENAREVSIRQLLNHTSGIRDYLEAEQLFNTLNRSNFLETQREKLRYVYGESAYHAPGEDYTYSNTNYVLLGLVIERARQMPLWEAVDQFIAEPLGLERFGMGTEQNPIPDDVARPYLANPGGRYFNFIEQAVGDAATGDGGIASNMQDLNGFMLALFSGDIVSYEALEEMTSDFQLLDEDKADFSRWPNEGYSLGVTRYNTDAGLAYGHTGLTSTYVSVSLYFPNTAAMVSISTNGIDLGNVDAFEDKSQEIVDRVIDIINE